MALRTAMDDLIHFEDSCVLEGYRPLRKRPLCVEANEKECCVHVKQGVMKVYFRCCVHDRFEDRKD